MRPEHEFRPANRLAGLLTQLIDKGVVLWLEDDQLRYRAPKGVLTPSELELIRNSRTQITSMLTIVSQPTAVGAELKERIHPCTRAPLTVSQHMHWRLYRLAERPGIRQVACAMRLSGRLQSEPLTRSLEEIMRRHDALRTRIVVSDGIPVQEIAEHVNCPLECIDLTNLSPTDQENEVQKQIDSLIMKPIDVGVPPLFGLCLMKLRDDEHVLAVAMEHLISDGYSLNILLSELLWGYTQCARGQPFDLPAPAVQFPEFAQRRSECYGRWAGINANAWRERFRDCQRVRFPDSPSSGNESLDWGTVTLRVDAHLKSRLLSSARQMNTTLAMLVFTAYVAAVLRWCNVREGVFKYQSDGRTSEGVESTIGYFASLLYLRVEMGECDSYLDLLKTVTEEYCVAHEHADFPCAVLPLDDAGFARNTTFNWLPQGPRTRGLVSKGTEHVLKCDPIRFSHPMIKNLDFEIDTEPSVLFIDTDKELAGDIYFPLRRFSTDAMRNFAQYVVACMEMLLAEVDRPLY